MKLCIICTTGFGADGITTFVMNAYKKFDHKKMTCSLVFPRFIGDQKYCLRILEEFVDGDTYHQLDKYGSLWSYICELYRFIKEGMFDVVHVHGSSCMICIEMALARMAGVKNVISHSHNTTGDHIWLHKMLKPVVGFLSNRRLGCGIAANKWMYGDKSSEVIFNGIEIDLYTYDERLRKQMRDSLDVDDDVFVIGHIGGFNHQKNHSMLVRIMENIERKNHNPKVCLLLIGSGPLFGNIDKMVSMSSASHSIKLLGQCNSIPQLLMAMDAFCLPSLYEGFPIVAVEAQASGLPVVMSDKISDEVVLTDLVHVLPIDNSEELWADCLLSLTKYKGVNRSEYVDIVRKRGFDIVQTARKLFDIYGEKNRC